MPESATRRLFIAIDAPLAVVADLATLAEPLPDFAWQPSAQLHLTLRFLGDTAENAVELLREKLATVRVASFLLPVEGVGTFPLRGQPHVVWAGVGSGHPRLHQLRQRVDDAVLALGMRPEMRSFVPHFTLARTSRAKVGAVTAWVHRHREFTAASFRVQRFRLYESELLGDGARHTPLAEFPLTD